MKCRACKYEHGLVDSNLPFRKIYISTNFFIADGYENGIYYSNKSIQMFACPFCGTVRIED